MSAEVVQLDKNSVSSILLKAKSYIVVYINDEGVAGFWDLNPNNTSTTEWLAMLGRMAAYQQQLGEMYNELTEHSDVVDM